MKSILKKTFLLGLGAASLSAKAINKAVKAYVAKNAIKPKEAASLAKQMLEAANAQRKKLQQQGEKEFNSQLRKYGISSANHLRALKIKAAKLEMMLRKKLRA